MRTNFRLLLAAFVSIAGCAQSSYRESANNDLPEESRRLVLADYCWSEKHFLSADYKNTEFVQFVNEDMVIYRLEGSSDLYCAFPVDGSKILGLVRADNKRFSRHRTVLPAE